MLKNHLMYCSGHWLTDLTGKKNERIGNQILNTCLQLFQPGSSACSRRAGVVLFFLYRELKHSSFLRTKQRCVLLLGGWGCVVMEHVALQLVHISQKHTITVNVFQSTQIWSWHSLTFRRLLESSWAGGREDGYCCSCASKMCLMGAACRAPGKERQKQVVKTMWWALQILWYKMGACGIWNSVCMAWSGYNFT